MTVRNSIIRQPVKFIYTRTVYRQHCRRVQAGVFAEVGSTNTHFTKRHELIPIPRHPPRSRPLSLRTLLSAPTTLVHFSSHHHRNYRYEERYRNPRYIGHVFALQKGHAEGYEPNH